MAHFSVKIRREKNFEFFTYFPGSYWILTEFVRYQ